MTRKSQALLILGPHRSGTSAFTRVANLLGVDLGREMLSPRSDNPQGYWEHREFFELHEQLLSFTDSAWHEYAPMPEGWRERDGVAVTRQELLNLVEREFGDSALWGLKDPRLCRLLPLWRDLLETLEVTPKFVILVRNPLEVVASLSKRNGFSRTKGLLLYLGDMLTAVRHTEGQHRVFVSYTGLLADWRAVVDDVGQRLSLDWPRDPDVAADEIEDFLEPSERHHRHTTRDLRQLPSVPEWVSHFYEALEKACRGEDRSLTRDFEEAQRHLDEAYTLFHPEMALLRGELSRLSDQLTALEEEKKQAWLLAFKKEDGPGGGEGSPSGEVLEQQIAQLSKHAEALEAERTRLERRARRAEEELFKVQKHLTNLLSTPFYRFTRGLRRTWRRWWPW